MLYLGLLPLVLAGLGWGIYKLATRPKTQPTVQDPALAAAPPGSDASRQDAERERTWTLDILATSLQTSEGMTAADVLGKLKEGAIEPALDPELKTPEGFAVFSARIADLDDTDTREALTEWQKTSAHTDLTWSESQHRALRLAAASIEELTERAAQHPAVQQYWQLKEQGRARQDDAVVPLRLVTLWPASWSEAHQVTAGAWLKSLVAQHGWPEHRILMQEVRAEHANPISLLDHLNVSARRAQLPTIGILLACDSRIDQEHVDFLANKNNLFGGKNTRGEKPGELAAGLLFADDQQSQLMGEGPFSRLYRASWASREKSADEKGRINADLLGRLVDLALETAKLDVSKVRMISADNDHKPSRESELAEMLVAKLPELDPSKDALKVAQACGSMSHMTTVAALCIAHQFVVDEQAPVVCASLHDPLLRAAVVLNIRPEAQEQAKPVDAKAA